MSKKRKPQPKRAKPKPTGWAITWQGKTWTDADLTGQHLAQLALLSGDDRFTQLAVSEEELRLYPAQGFMRLMNLLGALVAVDVTTEYGSDVDEMAAALEEIQKASADSILGALSFR